MFCTGCGTQSHDSDLFCGSCGNAQGNASGKDIRLASTPAVFRPGQTQPVAIPDGVAGWSWGAFFLNWIWAIGNSTWIGLLALVPYVNIPVAIWLGYKGREMAWRNCRWDNVEHFNRVQRRWSQWGIGLFCFFVGLIVLSMAMVISAGARQAAQDTRDAVVMKQESAEIVRSTG